MKNLEFKGLLDAADNVDKVMNIRKFLHRPSYIHACKNKALKVIGEYKLYSIPVSTLKKYTRNTYSGDQFSFRVSEIARGGFKELRGLSVYGYVLEKQGGNYQNALLLIKTSNN